MSAAKIKAQSIIDENKVGAFTPPFFFPLEIAALSVSLTGIAVKLCSRNPTAHTASRQSRF